MALRPRLATGLPLQLLRVLRGEPLATMGYLA